MKEIEKLICNLPAELENERRTFSGKVRDDNGVLWERWHFPKTGDVWLYNPETDKWFSETRDELGNEY